MISNLVGVLRLMTSLESTPQIIECIYHTNPASNPI